MLNTAQSWCSFSFNYHASQSLGKETALSPAARLLGIDALTCGCNNSALTAVKIDFKGQASPNQHSFSQEHSLSPSACVDSSKGRLTLAQMYTDVRLCVAFVGLSSARWAISLWIIIPLPVTAGESCQNNCPSSCCGSDVHSVWREPLKESQFELTLRPVSIAVVAYHRIGWLKKTAWRETATEAAFFTNGAAAFSLLYLTRWFNGFSCASTLLWLMSNMGWNQSLSSKKKKKNSICVCIFSPYRKVYFNVVFIMYFVFAILFPLF